MPGCANGPCDRSKVRGGPGCYLCDRVAKGLVNPSSFRAGGEVRKGEKALTTKQRKKGAQLDGLARGV